MSQGKYSEALDAYPNIDMSFSGVVTDKVEKAKNMVDSEYYYNNGLQFHNTKSYTSAYTEFSKVDKEYPKYEDAQKLMKESKDLAIQDYLNTADAYGAKGDYANAIKTLNKAVADIPNEDRLIKACDKYVSLQNTQWEAETKAEDAARQAEQEKQIAAAKAKAKSEGVRIGMTQQQILDSMWGKPDQINKTTTAYGTDEQWVYGLN